MDDNASVEDQLDLPKHLACAVPAFVAARFIATMNRLRVPSDEQDLERRFSAWHRLHAASAFEHQDGFGPLTQLIETLEAPNSSALAGELKWLGPGTLAYNDRIGVTALTSFEPPSKFWAIDLSQAGNTTVKYAGHMKPIPREYPARVGCWFRNVTQLRNKA
jgi:hypothetical protein